MGNSTLATKRKREVGDGGSSSRSKRQRKGGSIELHSYNPDDRISQLPEEMLLFILSFLTIKEAAMTCFLSTRWRYLGASVPRLDFNASFFPIEAHPNFPPLNLRHHYVRRVSKVVRLYRGENLEEFGLHFGLTEKHKRFIDRFIRFALSKKVRKLELDLNLPFEQCNNIYESSWDNTLDKEKMYAFRVGAAADEAGLPSPVCRSFRCFKSLTSLCLRSVRMVGDVLEGLLSNCPVLETLILQYIDELVSLKVVGPCLRLKHLEVSCCAVLKKIELYDVPSMASFKLCDNRLTSGSQWSDRNCFMRNLPGLVDASLVITSKMVDRFGMFNSHLSQLKRLTTHLFPDRLQVDLEVPSIHKLIGLLELDISCTLNPGDNLLNLVSLMEAAPYLEKITIRVWCRKPVAKRKSRNLEKAETRRRSDGLQHLKVMELAGYRGYSNEDDFISYMIENARALETIIIDPEYQTNWNGYPIFSEWEVEKIHKVSGYVRRHARRWLEGIIPPGIQLVIR